MTVLALSASVIGLSPDRAGAATAADTPVDLRTAYGLSGVTRTAYTGEGQTIAVYAGNGSPNYGLQADVSYFSNAYGVSDVTLNYYYATNQANGAVTGYQYAVPATDTATSGELAMDVEYAHYMAPKARIVIVTGDSQGGAAQYAAQYLGATSFSTSFAGYESSLDTDAEISNAKASSARFGYAAAAGMTSFSAVGDSGPYDFPASSPYVVGVGATNLYVNDDSTRSSESSWSTTGGGTSAIFATPGWQKGVNAGAYRTGPDVAIMGSGTNTMPVRVGGKYSQIAGTSLSSPVWAGIMALVQQARAAKGLAPLGTTETMTLLYGTLGTGRYATLFNDITASPSGAVHTAGVGWDQASGLGTPKVPALIAYLSSVPEPTGLAAVAAGAATLRRRRTRVSSPA